MILELENFTNNLRNILVHIIAQLSSQIPPWIRDHYIPTAHTLLRLFSILASNPGQVFHSKFIKSQAINSRAPQKVAHTLLRLVKSYKSYVTMIVRTHETIIWHQLIWKGVKILEFEVKPRFDLKLRVEPRPHGKWGQVKLFFFWAVH